MISLRGPVRRREGGQWEWTGVWAFGALPDEEIGRGNQPAAASKGQRSKGSRHRRGSGRKGAGPRPFRYTFHEAKEASTVPIPWYNCSVNGEVDTASQGNRSSPDEESLVQTSLASRILVTNVAADAPSENTAASLTSEGVNNGHHVASKRLLSRSPPHEGAQDLSISDEGNKRVVSSTESSPSSSPLRRPLDPEEAGALQEGSQPDDLSRGDDAGSLATPSNDGAVEGNGGGGEESSVVTNASSVMDDSSESRSSLAAAATAAKDVVVVSTPVSIEAGEKMGDARDAKQALHEVSRKSILEGDSPARSAVHVTPSAASLPPSNSSAPTMGIEAADSSRNTNGVISTSHLSLNGVRPEGVRTKSPAIAKESTTTAEPANHEITGYSPGKQINTEDIFRKRHPPEKGAQEGFPEKSRTVTFASVTKFKDAGLENPEKCPIGGSWRGYFENVQTRKDRKTSRVSENFVLYFNSFPMQSGDPQHPINGSLENFENEDEGEVNGAVAALYRKHFSSFDGSNGVEAKQRVIRVRGMGNNQFGTFDIVGLFDVSSGVLHCFRVYVQIPDDESSSPGGMSSKRSHQSQEACSSRETRRSRGKKSSPGDIGDNNSSMSRPYFTRKRQLSFHRRHDASSSEDERDMADKLQRQQERANRKRKDPSAGTSHGGDFPNHSRECLMNGTAKAGMQSQKRKPVSSIRPSHSSSSLLLPSSSVDSGVDSGLRHDGVSTPLSSCSFSTAAMSMPKKFKPNLGNQAVTGSSNTVIVLPTVADSTKAKWRSAHIFSKSKISTSDPSAAPPPVGFGTSAATAGTSSTPSANVSTASDDAYVPCIYEGELKFSSRVNNQVLQREGRGICLYENGNIYEGFWRRNKEHGRGILLTGDRRYVIYEGDWERGRMHGRGVYYYALDQNCETHCENKDGDGGLSCCSSRRPYPIRRDRGGGIYKGDFKENCRHGFGMYTLPDGSVYDGEWRDNVQCGRGTFRWLDGSRYEGQWREGKRHGNGTLRASNGFIYEGQWVSNAMDGRGSCLYPNGQRYEGLWSKGKKEGRGTIHFSNGAVYEGRFKDDLIEGQGTMKMTSNAAVLSEGQGRSQNLSSDSSTRSNVLECNGGSDEGAGLGADAEVRNTEKVDWMIPIQFQSDMGHIHQRAGFTTGGS